jgi:RNA polymerase sigma-70 factor, ECF subfamily
VSPSSSPHSRKGLTIAPPPGARIEAAATPSERLSALYQLHAPMVFRLALRYGKDRSWAEDITQDVFLQAFAHIDELAEVQNPGGWLYRVTTRRCLNRLRGQALRASAPVRFALQERAPQPNTAEELGIHKQRLARLFAQLERLPPKMQICFWMYHVDEKDQVEIGEILGHSKGYISKLLKRAKQALEEDDVDA